MSQSEQTLFLAVVLCLLTLLFAAVNLVATIALVKLAGQVARSEAAVHDLKAQVETLVAVLGQDRRGRTAAGLELHGAVEPDVEEDDTQPLPPHVQAELWAQGVRERRGLSKPRGLAPR